jgi:hypothetical protein
LSHDDPDSFSPFLTRLHNIVTPHSVVIPTPNRVAQEADSSRQKQALRNDKMLGGERCHHNLQFSLDPIFSPQGWQSWAGSIFKN